MAGNVNDYVAEQMRKYDISQTHGFLMDKELVSNQGYVKTMSIFCYPSKTPWCKLIMTS